MSGERDGLTGEPPDDIDRQLAELTSGLSKTAKFKEPSAAERARQQARPPGPGGWRRARTARKLREPVSGQPAVPWRAWSPPQQRRSRRSPARLAIGLVIMLVVAGAAYYVIPGLDRSHGVSDQPLAAGAAARSGLPAPTMAAPFRGTPAQSWANGAAGIVIPAPPAPGSLFPYTPAQITAAYQTTKQMLVAADLNGPTLAGGPPDAFAGLLSSQQRSVFLGRLDNRGTSGTTSSTRTWVTSFSRGTRLAGTLIKVHGSMSASLGSNHGSSVLVIHADYLFVYPVTWRGQPSTLLRIVSQDVVSVEFGTFTDPGGPLQAWWQAAGRGEAGARCDVHDGFVHPDFPGGPPDKAKPKGPAINPYDLDPSVSNAGCQNVTGT